MEKTVVIKYIRTSPKKLREVIYEVKGKRAIDTLPTLKMSVKKAANMLYKAVKSGMHLFDKAVHNELIIKNVVANGGPKFKRFRPGSKGMAHPYARKTSHLEVTIMLPVAAKSSVKAEVKPEKAVEKKATKVVKKTVKK